jgi:hypothetical protein
MDFFYGRDMVLPRLPPGRDKAYTFYFWDGLSAATGYQ